jgi:hypothetical protein
MALTCLPYLYALGVAEGRAFSGFLWGVDEGNVYLAWMRQAAEGEVFLRNQYCLAPENPRFLNLFFQVGGRLSALTGVTPKVMFHVLRVLGGVFLLGSLYLLVAELTRDRVARWAALLLASLGSGLGWLVVVNDGLWGLRPVDVGTQWQVQPEAVTFPSLLLNGLFVVAMGLMCVVLRYGLRAVRGNDTRSVIVAGLALLVLGNIHTYNVFAVHLALVLWIGLGAWRGGLGLRTALRQYAVIFVLGLPTVVWAVYAAQADPAFMAKGLTPTPAFRFVDYAVGYGLVGALALAGAWVTLRGRGAEAPDSLEASGPVAPPTAAGGAQVPALQAAGGAQVPALQAAGGAQVPALQAAGGSTAWLPVCWAIANSLVLLVPVSFQRKMIEGLHLPLCILAGMAVAAMAERITRGSRARGRLKEATERTVLTVVAVVAFALPSNALFVAECLARVRSNNAELARVLQPPLFLERADDLALRWLAANTGRDDVVLASSFVGSFIPTNCRARPWVGHWAETLALVEGGRYLPPTAPLGVWNRLGGNGGVQLARFGDNLGLGATVYRLSAASDLLPVLQEHHVTLVYYGPWEQVLTGGGEDSAAGCAVSAWRAEAARLLQVAYDADGVTIYRVPAPEGAPP